MLTKLIKYSFLLQTLSQETFIEPSTFNNIYIKKLNKKIKKLKNKIQKLRNGFKPITKRQYIKLKEKVKKFDFTEIIKKLKKEVKIEIKSLFSKKEKLGKCVYIKELIDKYKIKKSKISKDWNTILFLREVEFYLFNFIKKGGCFFNLCLNKEKKEEVNLIYGNNFNFESLREYNKLICINYEKTIKFNLNTAYCLGCKKEIDLKVLKYHLDSKIHKKYTYTVLLPDEDYFNYLFCLFLLTLKRKKKKKEYFFHCEICCKNECIKKECKVSIKKRESHFVSESHKNNLTNLNINLEKGNFIFKKEIALNFVNKEKEIEMEDEEGNLYDLQTYLDLKKLNLL